MIVTLLIIAILTHHEVEKHDHYIFKLEIKRTYCDIKIPIT